MKMEDELPDGDSEGVLTFDQILVAERVAAARPNCAIRMSDVIKRIIARDNLARLVFPPDRMPAPPTLRRARPSKLNAHLPPFRRHVDSSDEKKPKRPVWQPRRPRVKFDVVDYEQEKTPSLSRRNGGRGRDAARIYSLTQRQAWTEKQVVTTKVTTRIMI